MYAPIRANYFENEAFPMATSQILQDLDEVDYALIRELQKNARITNADLAAAVGIAQSTCISRVRNLSQRGVITGYSAAVDPKALGLDLQVLISVTLRAGASSELEFVMGG